MTICEVIRECGTPTAEGLTFLLYYFGSISLAGAIYAGYLWWTDPNRVHRFRESGRSDFCGRCDRVQSNPVHFTRKR